MTRSTVTGRSPGRRSSTPAGTSSAPRTWSMSTPCRRPASRAISEGRMPRPPSAQDMHRRRIMRTISQLALVIAAVGCGGSQPLPRTELHGYAARMEAADRDDQLADAHRRAAGPPDTLINPDNYQCGDINLDQELTSGGKPLVRFGAHSVPCWNPAEEYAQRQRLAAERLHRRAQSERHAAASLIEAEIEACHGI